MFDAAWESEFLGKDLISKFTADRPSAPGHHIFLENLARDDDLGTNLVFSELGNRIDPSTGRPYFDIGSNSDNLIPLLGSQSGASNVNVALDIRGHNI